MMQRRHLRTLFMKGLLVLTAGDNVVRLAPPLTVSAVDVAAALDVLARVVTLPR